MSGPVVPGADRPAAGRAHGHDERRRGPRTGGGRRGGRSAGRDDAARGALVADVQVRRGAFALAASLTVEPGRVTAVLGPNGAGKSTLLALLAGTLGVARGHVRVGDRVLTRATFDERAVRVPVDRRAVGLLGQDPLVFPHLDVLENVAFGPRAAGVRAARARDEAAAWLDAVGLGELARRRPDELSGGQRQRVALARALAARPDALLLDEPFAQLDVRTAAELRDVVREHVRAARVPTVLVTHDVVDVLALADHVVVLHDGVVVEQGDPVTVLTDPVHPFTAALADLNLVHVTASAPADAPTDASTPSLLRSQSLALAFTGADVALWVEKASPRVTFSTHDVLQLTFSPGDVRICGGGGDARSGCGGGRRAVGGGRARVGRRGRGRGAGAARVAGAHHRRRARRRRGGECRGELDLRPGRPGAAARRGRSRARARRLTPARPTRVVGRRVRASADISRARRGRVRERFPRRNSGTTGTETSRS